MATVQFKDGCQMRVNHRQHRGFAQWNAYWDLDRETGKIHTIAARYEDISALIEGVLVHRNPETGIWEEM